MGPKLFGGKYFEILHDSACNIRDARETQHLTFRKTFKVPENNSESNMNKSGQNKRKTSNNETNKDENVVSKKFKTSGNKNEKKGSSGYNRHRSEKGVPQLEFRSQK